MTIIQLCNFIAILQLLAGVCVLFFYDDILRSLITTPARKQSLLTFESLLNVVQGDFSPKDDIRIRGLIDMEISPNAKESILPRFRNVVNNLGRFGFVLLLTLLFTASLEDVNAIEYKFSYIWLGMAAVAFIVGSVILFRYRYKKWAKGYWRFVVGIVFLLPLVYLTFSSGYLTQHNSIILYGILLTFLIIPVMSIVIYLYDERRCKSLYKELNELKFNITGYAEWEVNGWEREYFRRLPPKMKWLLSPDDDSMTAQNKMQTFTRKQLHDIFEKHKTKNILLLHPLSNLIENLFSRQKHLFTYILIIGYIIICSFVIAKIQ